jgi:hypothetical protein
MEKQINQFTNRGNKITKTCIECSNNRALNDYCEHGTRDHDCAECNEPLHRRALMMLKTKSHDKLKCRENDLTYDNVKDLLLHCNDLCAYCGINLQHETKNKPNYSSIERMHNSKGHLIDNCIITCLECNVRRVGDTIWY